MPSYIFTYIIRENIYKSDKNTADKIVNAWKLKIHFSFGLRLRDPLRSCHAAYLRRRSNYESLLFLSFHLKIFKIIIYKLSNIYIYLLSSK